MVTFAIVVVCLGVLAGVSQAENLSWDGGAGTAFWDDANNWNPNKAPTLSDDAAFMTDVDVVVRDAQVIYRDNVNTTSGNSGSLTIGSGGSLTMANGQRINWVGGASVGDGTITVKDGGSLSAGFFDSNQGAGSTATFEVLNGGTATFSTSFSMNDGAGTADVLVDGSGSTMTVNGDTTISASAGGTLTISGGGTFAAGANLDYDPAKALAIGGSGSRFELGTGGTGGAISQLNTITIASGGIFSVNQSDSVTQGTEFGNSISGDGSLEQAGTGTTTLNVANSHSGGTTLSSGTLVLGDADAAGTGTITLSGGTLEIAAGIGNDISATGSTVISNNTGTLSFSGGAVTGAGALAFSVTQQTRLFSDLSGFSGTISHDNDAGGQLRLWNQAADLSATRIVTSGGTSGGGLLFINSGNDHTIGELSGTGGKILMRGGSGLTLTIEQSTDTTYSGLLQDGDASRKGTLVKDGVGTLTLDGANTYTGTTTIDEGTLQLGNGGAAGSLATASAISVASGATFAVKQSDTVTQGTDFSGAAISGDGGFEQNGSGTTVLTAANTYLGATTVSNGTLQLGNGGGSGSLAADSAISVSSGATLAVNRNDAVTQGTDFSTAAISGDGSFEQNGTGTTTLNVANTYTGGTTLNDGILHLGAIGAAGTGTLTLSGGKLTAFSSTTSHANDIVVTDATSTAIFAPSGNNYYGGEVTGTGNLNFGGSGDGQGSGTVRIYDNGAGLSGFSGTITHDNVNGLNNLYLEPGTGAETTPAKIFTSGATDGTCLRFRGAWEIGELSGTGGRIAAWNSTVTVNQDSDTTYSGLLDNISGRVLTLVKDGSGSLSLNFSNTYTGTTTIDGGTLLVNNASGSATGTGALNVNSGGTLGGTGTVSGVVTVNSGGHVSVDASSSEITLTGGLTLNAGAELDVDLSSYSPASGSTLVLVDYNGGSLIGTFSAINLTAGWTADVDYVTGNQIRLTNLIRTIISTQNGNFDVGTTWVGGVAPASGIDSVVIDHTLNLFSEFTIGSGQSMTSTVTTSGMRIGDGGHLTVATGGSMNLPGFDMPESGAGGHLTIEAGATARVDRYWNDEGSPSYINEWIADASGVTAFQIDGKFTLRGTESVLEVDLTDYDIANGDTLVLVDYGSLVYQSGTGFGTVNIYGGLTGTIDYVTDNQIRIIGIGVPGTVFKFK